MPAVFLRRLPTLRCLAGIAVLLFPLLAHAQRARWEPSGGSLGLRQVSQLSLIFEDCEPTGEVTPPNVANLTIGQPSRGEQSSFNIVNGEARRSKTVYFTYPVRPDERGTVTIPAFTVSTDKGPATVPAATFEVGEATIAGSSVPLDSAASSRVNIGSGQLWAGEVVPVNYVLSVASRFPASYASGPEWNPAPLVVEEWSKPQPGSVLVNGENRNTITYQSRGYIRDAGTYALEPIHQLVNIRVPSSGFSIFQAFQAEQYTITSNRPELIVRPLPAPAPRGFNGAVGQFQLTSQVVPARASVGEPVTWTLALTGTGNWPDIPGLPARDVSRDFRVVQPQAQRSTEEGRLFDGRLSEDVVLIPTRPGTYRLGPVTWSYFDPRTGTYETVTTEPTTVEVGAAAGTPQPGTTPPPEAPPNTEVAAPVRATPAPVAPDAIPRDPLPIGRVATSPWTWPTVGGIAAALLGLVPLTWFAFAWQRAVRTDPGRAARQARQRLRQTLVQLEATTEPDRRRPLIHSWQHDVATLWGLRRAVPVPEAFGADETWKTLWAESERVIYGRGADLPPDWTSRARRALEQRAAPRFRSRRIFTSAMLLPGLALVIALGTAGESRAANADEAYRQGQFRQAERQWREHLATNPTDWSAHHNLSLALAQQERWAESAAHALASFVQNPAHPAVRWQTTWVLSRAGFAPLALAEFTRPDLRHRLAWQLSPTGWQRALLGAAGLLALALIALLMRAYRGGRTWTWIAGLVGMAALLLASAAAVSLPRFGLAADHRAVLFWKATPLRSLPTDLSTTQQTSTLAPGTLATVEHAFLGWRRLGFPNGQTGWVRQEEFVPLWSGGKVGVSEEGTEGVRE